MTTAVKSSPAQAPAAAPAKILFQGLVAIDKIDVVSNIRTTFDQKKLAELTESVRKYGVEEPIVLRPGAKSDRYILVDGERRFRASKAAELKQIPAIVRDYSAEDAITAQLVSFLHREGLGPIEEARGFKVAFDSKKYTVEQLAQLVDKSVPYVYRSVKLLDLPETVLKAIESGDMTPAHGHQILRVSGERRAEIVDFALKPDWAKNYPTAKDLMQRVDRDCGYNLADAVFPKDVQYAGAIACTGCQYNTGNQGKLFDGAEKGGCTNTPCFDTKTTAAWQAKADALHKRFPDAVVAFHDYSLVPGMSIHGAVVKNELAATTKNLKADQSLVISKQSGKVYVASKPKPVKKEAPAALKGESEKERSIRNAVIEHLNQVEEKLVVAASDKQMLAVMVENWANGWEKNFLKNAGFAKITPTNLLRAFWRLEMNNGCALRQDVLLPLLGSDFKKETAIATKAATEAWDKAHPAKAAK